MTDNAPRNDMERVFGRPVARKPKTQVLTVPCATCGTNRWRFVETVEQSFHGQVARATKFRVFECVECGTGRIER